MLLCLDYTNVQVKVTKNRQNLFYRIDPISRSDNNEMSKRLYIGLSINVTPLGRKGTDIVMMVFQSLQREWFK